jgi:hypothetical protein
MNDKSNGKSQLLCVSAFLLLSILSPQLSPLYAQGTAFTYQGQLQNNGSPANGSYNLTFTLFNTCNGITAIAGPVTNDAVNVTNGMFTVQIDFGAEAFTGQTNWLQIGVASNGVSAFTTLSPLQELTPVPEAIYANSTSNLLGALPSAQLSGMIALTQLPTAVVTTNETSVTLDNLTLDGTLYLPSPEIMSDGDSLLSASLTNRNFFGGLLAGNPANNTGDNNTAIGNEALYSNTNGSENTTVGSGVLFENTSGSENTAIGTAALSNNTNGSENTANGVQTLFENMTGSGNTANGYAALYNLTNGSQNIALGFTAGAALLMGSSNIDIGSVGVKGDNNVIRLGSTQTATYLAGNVYASGAVFSNGVDLVSDRNAKEGFAVINPQSVLEKVAALPVTEWNYKTTKNMEHIGPMAQDFHAAFGLNGQDDKHISVVDESGVALAAIQGLNQMNQKLQAELNRQLAENAKLEQRIENLEQRMNREAAQ